MPQEAGCEIVPSRALHGVRMMMHAHVRARPCSCTLHHMSRQSEQGCMCSILTGANTAWHPTQGTTNLLSRALQAVNKTVDTVADPTQVRRQMQDVRHEQAATNMHAQELACCHESRTNLPKH